jgi:hypothetical protein
MDDSNIDEVVRYLENFLRSFDFTRKDEDQSLGRDITLLVAERIAERSARGVDAQGNAWPVNSDKPSHWHKDAWGNPLRYRTWKQLVYGWSNPNYRTGQMLSTQSLRGDKTTIQRTEILTVYGTDEPPDRGGSPTRAIAYWDKNGTDTDKAYYAHDGQSKQRIKRPFYELNDEDVEAIVALCQDNLTEMIRETNSP